MNVLDMVHSLVALAVCGAAFGWCVERWPTTDRRVAMYCWYAHAAGAFAIVSVYKFYYGGGDLTAYHRQGGFLVRYVEYDFVRNMPQLLRLFLQQSNDLPLSLSGGESSTGTMFATAALTGLITSSLWAGSILVSTLAATGQACLWAGLRHVVPPERRSVALWCTFLVPSLIFWTSSFQKEAFALTGLGVVVMGGGFLKTNQRLKGLFSLAVGASVIGLYKPYILFPLAVAMGTYFYWDHAASRGGVRIRPLTFLLGAAVTVGLLTVLGTLFPRYAIDTVAESVEQQQMASLTSQGGSDFRDDDAERQSGTAGLLADAPFTVMTALFRPFFFESRSVMMLVNSLEMSVVLYLVFMALLRTSRAELLFWVWRSPDIMASVVFVLLFSLAVGLATTNLGTLSRYRLPMMPFYFYVVFSAYALPTLRQTQRQARHSVASASNSSIAVGYRA
jgi:hypothetical protein